MRRVLVFVLVTGCAGQGVELRQLASTVETAVRRACGVITSLPPITVTPSTVRMEGYSDETDAGAR